MNKERSESTRKGLLAEQLVRRAIGGRTGQCDIHTDLGGFELRWGRTTKNSAGLKADRARAAKHGGYCVQIEGHVSRADRAHGDRSLYELLRQHGVPNAEKVAQQIREQAQTEAIDNRLELTTACPTCGTELSESTHHPQAETRLSVR